MAARSPFDSALGANISLARVDAQMTQQTVAVRLGMNGNQYQRLESGAHRISAFDLARIAVVVGVPVTKLIPEMVWNDGTLEVREAEA